MAKYPASNRRDSAGDVSLNMTPLIDCTFLLIVFFILASQMASQSLAKVLLHRPRQSRAIPSEQMDTPDKVIVNVVSAVEGQGSESPALLGKAGHYQIGSMKMPPGDSEVMSKVLRRLKVASGSEKFKVEIRADYRVDYDQVLPVMRAAAQAGILRMNLTALTDTDGK